MIGIESGSIILPDAAGKFIGLWTLTAYEGDPEYNDCGRIINRVVWSTSKYNLVVTTGKALSLDRVFGLSAASAISGTGVGTSATAAAVADTALVGAVYKAFDATPTRSTLTVTGTTTYLTTEANITIQETGLQTAAGGVLFNRLAPIGPFGKTTATSLSITTAISQA